ncbi:hypothetical protein H1215_08605, partial [Anoxybacillus sp. LAT_38]
MEKPLQSVQPKENVSSMRSRISVQTKYCWGEKHVSGFRSVLALQGSTDCTLRTDLRGIAKAASLRSSFKGGAPFSRKSLLRSVGLTSRSAWKHA